LNGPFEDAIGSPMDDESPLEHMQRDFDRFALSEDSQKLEQTVDLFFALKVVLYGGNADSIHPSMRDEADAHQSIFAERVEADPSLLGRVEDFYHSIVEGRWTGNRFAGETVDPELGSFEDAYYMLFGWATSDLDNWVDPED
jgi:hypothetical protein